jgi:hypothetical protein
MKGWGAFGLVLVVSVLLWWGLTRWQSGQSMQSTNQQFVPPPIYAPAQSPAYTPNYEYRDLYDRQRAAEQRQREIDERLRDLERQTCQARAKANPDPLMSFMASAKC